MTAIQIPPLTWSEQVNIVRDDRGRKHHGFTASPTQEFWGMYRQNKEQIKLAGYKLLLLPNRQWLVVKGAGAKESVISTKESIEASRALSSDIKLRVPEGLEYLPFQKAGIEYALRKFGLL